MRYYNFLNESFNKMLNEAKQDEINFANVFGEDILNRFKAQKQRMQSPMNDFYYWIRKSKDNLEGTIEEIELFLDGIEGKKTRKQKRELAAEGAEVVFEDDKWLVLRIDTYEAAAKYGSGTTWCITGRYHGAEDSGEYYFNNYKEEYGWDYYFYILKNSSDDDGRQEKWCLCYADDDDWCIYNAEDDNITEDGYGIPDAPKVEGLPDVSDIPENHREDYPDDFNEPEDDDGDYHQAPREPETFVNVEVEDPNDYEFPAQSKAEAARMFKDGAEVIETVREPDLHIVKWHEEPEPRPEGEEGPEDTGDRYTLFVFFPGEGGGPLLAQTGRGFALQVFKDLDKVRQFASRMPGMQIMNNRRDTEDMPECLKENFYYYNDNSWFYDI